MGVLELAKVLVTAGLGGKLCTHFLKGDWDGTTKPILYTTVHFQIRDVFPKLGRQSMFLLSAQKEPARVLQSEVTLVFPALPGLVGSATSTEGLGCQNCPAKQRRTGMNPCLHPPAARTLLQSYTGRVP